MEPLKTFTAKELMENYIPTPCPENMPPLTLFQIISIEPRIAWILATLKPSQDDQEWYCQYSEAKSTLCRLVGWEAEQYALRTCQAYDVVLDTVLEMLDSGKGGAPNGN